MTFVSRSMENSRVTCVIPTHRRPEELLNAVRSVAQQTLAPREILVINDAEPAEVALAIDSIRPITAVPIRHISLPAENRGGASRSRNAGARLARSEFVAFLDDDDHWEPQFLAKTLPDDSTYDLSFSWIDVRTQEGNIVHERCGFVPHTAQQIVSQNPGFTGSNIIVRRDAFESLGGFDENLRAYNDIDYLVRAVAAGQHIRVTPTVLAHQNLAPGEHLSTRSRQRAKAVRTYKNKHTDLLTKADRRRLERDYHLSSRGTDTNPAKRAGHFVLMWVNSTPSDLLHTVRQRASGAKRAYER